MSHSTMADKAPAKAHVREMKERPDDQTDIPIQDFEEVVAAATNYSLGGPDRSLEVDASPQLTKTSRVIITALIILTNLIQYISMFTTVAAGFKFSEVLGHASGPGQANWMAAAYSLTQSAFVLVSGRLGAVFGHKRMLIFGGGIIVVFSLINAFCTTYESFVALRALTGIGGGILMPNAVAMLTIMVPPGRARNITLATFAASPPVGALIGALLAGAFLEKSEWKYLFIFISLFGAVVFTALTFILPPEDPVDKHGEVDWVGIALGVSGLALFNFSWNQAPSAGWRTPYVIATLVLSVLAFLAFLLWERHLTNSSATTATTTTTTTTKTATPPIMPLAIFATPTFTALILVVLLTYMAFGISLWYTVAWQTLLRGWTPLHLAVGWTPFAVGASAAVALAAWLIPRVRARWILALGIAACLASNVLLATMPRRQLYWKQAFPAIVVGSLCPDFVFVAAQIIASDSVGKRDQGVAGSLVGTLNLYGVSLGLGFAGTIEVEVVKGGGGEVWGYRAALLFGAALAVVALVLDFAFVRVPKHDGEGWKGGEGGLGGADTADSRRAERGGSV